jgi:hypothetical protein
LVVHSVTDKLPSLGLAAKDNHRLSAHQIVIGVVVNGVPQAYPLETVRELGKISGTLGGEEVTIRYLPDGDAVDVKLEGASLPVERGWWQGWSEFHPETDVYPSL